MYTNKSKSNDEGVSPVVGVILMVAIAVILSAILATTVLNIGGAQDPARAGLNMAQTPGYGGTSFSFSGSGVCSGQMGGYTVQTTLMTEGNVDKVTLASVDKDYMKISSAGESMAYCNVPSGMQVTAIGHANGVSNALQFHTVQPTDGKTYDVTADINNPDGKEVEITPESKGVGKAVTSTTSFNFMVNGDYTLAIKVDTDGDGVTDTTIGTWDVGSGSTTISGENVDVTLTQNGVYCEINSCN